MATPPRCPASGDIAPAMERNRRPAGRDQSAAPLRFTVGCLFAAIGGFCRAFQAAGATVAWANEKDRYAKETFTLNFPKVRFIHKPIEELSVEDNALRPVDVLTAGFPCQPFSVAGDKLGFKDERGSLFLHIIRLIREFGPDKPKVLLLENVKHFRAHDGGRTFKRMQAEIQKAGYCFRKRTPRFSTPRPTRRSRRTARGSSW